MTAPHNRAAHLALACHTQPMLNVVFALINAFFVAIYAFFLWAIHPALLVAVIALVAVEVLRQARKITASRPKHRAPPALCDPFFDAASEQTARPRR